jgi:hypothetical protein
MRADALDNLRRPIYVWRTMLFRAPFFGLILAATLLALGLPNSGAAPENPGSATVETPEDRAEVQHATAAVNDLLAHWWVGDAATGHITPTHGGCPTNNRGVIWERAMMICAMEGLSENGGGSDLNARITAQWRDDKAHYKMAELQGCGAGSINPWCDDACWSLLYYVIVYQQTGDHDALEDAMALIRKIDDRWHDDQLGGGLWYNDQRKVKSLYGVAFAYAGLALYEATGEQTCRDLAMAEYDWIEAHLKRADNLYWCEASAGSATDPRRPPGPVGQNRPRQIREASSVVFLGGNMGMGACHGLLYQLTGVDGYRQAALRTAAALREGMVDGAGRYINDRDAFTNGVFGSIWARRVLTLPGADARDRTILRATADAIVAARTGAGYAPAYGPGGAGYYPADWSGGSVWESKGSMANMLHVSASSVGLVVGAAYR